MVECPLQAYWRGSILPSNCDSSLLQTNPSMTLASVQVRDIGLRSLSMVVGGVTLGIGVTMDDLKGLCQLGDMRSRVRFRLICI